MKETVEEATNKFQEETERLLNELLPDQKKKKSYPGDTENA